MLARWRAADVWLRSAVVLWVGLTLFCALRSALRPHSHTVYPIYTHAAWQWRHGEDLYVPKPGYDFYRYSPAVAVFMSALTPLGDALGGALWRVGGVVLFASGLAAWLRAEGTKPLPSPRLGLFCVLLWPVLLQNVNNGQVNLHVGGLLLWGTADALSGRPWRSAWTFAAAAVVKPYVLALPLLLGLIDRRLFWRLGLATAALVLSPFLFRSPQYVVDQHCGWWKAMVDDDRSINALARAYRDLPMLCRVYAVPMPTTIYRGIEVAVGIGMAGLIVAGVRAGWPRPVLFERAFALAAVWLTTLGPATESCTYLLLGPALMYAAVTRPGRSGWPVRWAAALLIAPVAASLFPDDWRVQVLGPQPVAGLVFLGFTLYECVGDFTRPSQAPLQLSRAA